MDHSARKDRPWRPNGRIRARQLYQYFGQVDHKSQIKRPETATGPQRRRQLLGQYRSLPAQRDMAPLGTAKGMDQGTGSRECRAGNRERERVERTRTATGRVGSSWGESAPYSQAGREERSDAHHGHSRARRNPAGPAAAWSLQRLQPLRHPRRRRILHSPAHAGREPLPSLATLTCGTYGDRWKPNSLSLPGAWCQRRVSMGGSMSPGMSTPRVCSLRPVTALTRTGRPCWR